MLRIKESILWFIWWQVRVSKTHGLTLSMAILCWEWVEQWMYCLRKQMTMWSRCGALRCWRTSRGPFLSLYTMFQMMLPIVLNDDINKEYQISFQSEVCAPLGIPETTTAVHKHKTIFVIICKIFTFRCAHIFSDGAKEVARTPRDMINSLWPHADRKQNRKTSSTQVYLWWTKIVTNFLKSQP